MKMINKRYIPILVLMLSGCTTIGNFRTANKSSIDTSYITPVESVERIIDLAEISYRDEKLQESRQYCDEALKKLFKIEESIDSEKYEHLHSQVAMIRFKANHSKHSKASAVKSDLFPLVWNTRVEKWINYYTGRGRPNLERCIARSEKYIKDIKKILAEENVPQDLIYVPVVESAYYAFARSRVGAVGLWQFMEKTGKLNGLKKSYWIDERRDPYKSTYAAAKELKKLYAKFGTWELALAAYNYGANGVRRRIKKWKTNDYWELYLPRETENFVPKIMAAIFILREPEIFGFKKAIDENKYTWKEFEVKDSVDLRDIAKWSGTDIKEIQLLNSELTQMCTPPKKKYTLRIPEKAYEKLTNKFNTLDHETRYLSKKEIDKRVRRVVYYRVKKGDSLWKICRKFKVSMRKLKKWNKLTSNRIYPRQKLKIYRHGI
jgi:membrane-bound lytic murein transglycosylase D